MSACAWAVVGGAALFRVAAVGVTAFIQTHFPPRVCIRHTGTQACAVDRGDHQNC